jgi:hypothetical protein
VELGGDKPALTVILLAIVVTAIFTTAYGVGAVVAIGVIVFPIMLSLGIPKPLATGTFAMAVTNGLYLNNALLSQAAGTMQIGEEMYNFRSPEWYRFAFVATAIHLVFVAAMVLISLRKKKTVTAWAAQDVNLEGADANFWAILTPLLPVTLSLTTKMSAILAIVLSVIWALGWTGYLKKGWNGIADVVQKTFFDGVSDVGLVLGFLLFLQMFIRSAGVAKAFLAPIVAPILPENVFLLYLVFGVFAVLALFRGPLTIWGAGAATFAIIAGTGMYPLAVLYPLFYIPCSTITTNVCPTQSWNLWGIGYTKISVKEFMKQTLPYALPLAFVLLMVAYFMIAANVA